MKIEDIKNILYLLQEQDIIKDYRYIGEDIFSINYGRGYIGLNNKGQLEKDCEMLENYAEIVKQENKLTNLKADFKKNYKKFYK